ncbi:MAG: phosphodiesterase, partial [Desulfovibrio sp.]|nr:phosphodiesterase [Desulfovibrio sp.]
MRMLIASDLHGSNSSLEYLINACGQINPDALVLLGDLVYHGPRNPLPSGYDTASVLGDIHKLMKYPIVAVRGNCDAEVDAAHMPFPMPDYAWINADGLNILACHGHHLPEKAPLHGIQDGSVILRGHTHIPRGETDGPVPVGSPGSISLPKNGFHRSYGSYEDGH